MSTDSGSGPDRVPGLRFDGDGDRSVFVMPYDESMAADSVQSGLAEKTSTEPEPDSKSGGTPDPEPEDGIRSNNGGPVRRFNDVFTDLGSVQLEALGLDGYEVSNATATLRDEMYRSSFPIIQQRFATKCVDEDCGAEYDREIAFCVQCARREMMKDGVETPPTDPEDIPEEYQSHRVRPPDPTEKRRAERLVESVNKEGQSLRELMKLEEDDQSRLGVSVMVVKKDYAVASGDTSVYDRGEIVYEGTDELVRGDPKRIVPVVDENGRVGNYWWTCPVHRKESLTKHREWEEEYERHCGHCGAELREVFFAEVDQSRHSRTNRPEKLFFSDEIVTWARYYPRLNGLDGLSPMHHVWLKQAILHWMDIYGGAYYDPDSDSYPNKFMVVHTTNPQSWEKQFEKAEDDAKENPYSEQIMYNEYSGESNSTPEVQVIDLMSDELLGQNSEVKDQFKQDIRTHFGVTNVFDSELKDAGGLNNEGLQMEVTDRTIASAMHDTVAGPLDELAKTMGINDYIFEFVPPQDTDIEDLRKQIQVGTSASQAGLDARLEDNKTVIADGEFEAAEEEGGGGLGGLFGGAMDDDGADEAEETGDEGAESLFGEKIDGPESEKADPMTNGHDMDPGTGEVTCNSTGATMQTEGRWSDIDGECPECGEEMSIVGQKAVGDDGWSSDALVFRVVPAEGDEDDYNDDVLGVGIDFPEAGVYVDWHREAFPDALEEPHVSEYGSVKDFKKATNNDVVDYGPVGGGGTPDAPARKAAAASEAPWRVDGPDRTPAEDADKGETAREHYTDEDEEGKASSGPGGETERKLAEVRKLDDAFRHIVWADETTKADSFWTGDGKVPEFVKELIDDVAYDTVTKTFESIPGALQEQMADLFVDKFTQPQGWSLASLTDAIVGEFGADPDDAELVARTETANILNNAREEGYERLGATDDALFRWIGPQDHRTTDACEWLKEQTEGGVTFDRLIELQKQAYDEFPEELGHLEWRKHLIHPNERHTFTETFKLERHPSDPIEVEYKMDISPAMTGTFVSASGAAG